MALWTQEEMEKLQNKSYTPELDDLVIEFGRSRSSLISRMCIINKNRGLSKDTKKLERCPNCNNLINKVEQGYFCRFCLKEYDNHGDFLAPLGGDMGWDYR